MTLFKYSKMWIHFIKYILLVLVLIDLCMGKNVNEVTCGSVVKLMNTHFKVRLHSHDISYSSGSEQQSVTGIKQRNDVNSNWAIKGTPNTPCQRGEPIICGSKIRLQHLETSKYLHSHLFSSPISDNQEISAFGENDEGDTGDIWDIICNGIAWERDEAVKFRHQDTNSYLSASGYTYKRFIKGQMEIVGVDEEDETSYWKTMEGIFINPIEFISPKKNWDHNEL